MRILQTGIAYYPAVSFGGPIKSIRNMCLGLTELGHDCTVCVTDTDGKMTVDVPLKQRVNKQGIAVYYFHSPCVRYYGWSPSMHGWLRRNVTDYDIVHINGIWNFPQIYAAALCRKRGIPYVISPRGSADGRKVREFMPRAKWLYTRLLNRRAFTAADAFVYTTIAEKENSILDFTGNDSFISPNAVEPVPPADPSDADRDVQEVFGEYILFVGRVSWVKQIDVLIRAFAALGDVHQKYNLVVTGPDYEGLTKRYRKLAQTHGLSQRVIFTGLKKGDELYAIYRNARLFVLPSVNENFGHTLIEALLFGVPSVASRNVDAVRFREVADITHIVDPSVSGIREGMQTVLEHYDSWKEKVDRGNSRIESLFRPKEVALRLENEYARIIEKERRG